MKKIRPIIISDGEQGESSVFEYRNRTIHLDPLSRKKRFSVFDPVSKSFKGFVTEEQVRACIDKFIEKLEERRKVKLTLP